MTPHLKKNRNLCAIISKFIDPAQERIGIDEYIKAQDVLIKRCDVIYLESHPIAINNSIVFIEWTMGLKIKGLGFYKLAKKY
tara:strand:+ start:226 stop:471 length:246 start_codon:yes stop_codon:yes gene_type:complete